MAMAAHILARGTKAAESAQAAFAGKHVSAIRAGSFPMGAGLLLGLADGLFHAATYVFVLWGLGKLWAMLAAGWLLTRRYRHPLSMLSAATSPEPGEDADLSSESVAGEEDPGASLDLCMTNGAGSNRPGPVSEPVPNPSPGDEAPEGTPGTGEGLCRQCGGSGRVGDATCPSCQGSGKVVVGIGGA